MFRGNLDRSRESFQRADLVSTLKDFCQKFLDNGLFSLTNNEYDAMIDNIDDKKDSISVKLMCTRHARSSSLSTSS